MYLRNVKYGDCVNAMLFNKDETQKIIAFKEGNQEAGKTHHPGDHEIGKTFLPGDVRVSKITWLQPDDSPAFAWVYDKLIEFILDANQKFFDMDLEYVEPLQLTEYDAAYEGHYGQHIDCAFSPMSAPFVRKLSVTVQLSAPEEYEGGDFRIYNQRFDSPLIADKTLGSVVIFRSHFIHEVMPVTKGVRYSLVAWVNGPVPR